LDGYDKTLKFCNDRTSAYYRLKSSKSSAEITREDLDENVLGDDILKQYSSDMANQLKGFNQSRTNYIGIYEKFASDLSNQLVTRKNEANVILNSHDVTKPNAAKYLKDNNLADEIDLVKEQIKEIERFKKVTESYQSIFANLNLRTTLINRTMFAEKIDSFDEALAIYSKQVTIFQEQLIEEIEKLETLLDMLNQEHRDNGYSQTSRYSQIWIDDYLKSNHRSSILAKPDSN
jgi:hypothetical protein